MPQAQKIVNLRKFKVWVTANLTPDNPLYQVVQKEKDELPFEEAVVKSGMICALIDTSVTSKTLVKQGLS
jgi:hypothetical protein